MSDGALKPEKDFSKEADKQIPEAETLAKVRLDETLFDLEKDADYNQPCRPTSKRPSRSSPLSRSKRAR